MQITVADERVLLLEERISMEQAEGRAWSKKGDAFGTITKVTRLLQQPKDDEFELIYKEHRYQPFWHVVCSAHYIYDRTSRYSFAPSGPEVQSVTIEDTEYKPDGGSITLTGLDHCAEEAHQEVLVEGITSDKVPALSKYLKFPSATISAEDLDSFAPEGTIVVPPQARSSAIVREVLAGMIKSVQADHILQETVDVEHADLYYRPVYAFQYRWLSKQKEAILECDALTGELQAGGKTFQQYLGKVLDVEFLFDVGVDAADLLLPGGGLAVRVARKGFDVARSRRKKDK
jgi:hypothetical protein